MNFIKSIGLFFITACLFSCNQNFSDKEKELLDDSINEAIEASRQAPTTDSSNSNTAEYDRPFCDLVSVDLIQSIFPDAENFEIKEMKQKRPECEITFESGRMIGNYKSGTGVIIGGFLPRKRETPRTFLERQLAGNPNHQKVEGLGDEAYLFPHDMSSAIIIIKNNLSYRIQLNRYVEDGESNQEDLLRLARAVEKNMK